MSSAIPPDPEPIRKRSDVERRGRAVREASGHRTLADLGLLDVAAAPYHADPTGERDSTAAIQQAINDARDAQMLTYLPGGRYRISDTITGIQGTVAHDHWPHGAADAMLEYRSYCFPCTLAGPKSGPRARLELVSNAPGFGDPAHPKPVVHFWAREETRSRDTGVANPHAQQLNISFNQQITDVDFSLGQNPGAVAIDHQGAQGSTVEDVTIEATGAFAGLRGLNGSGGGTHGVTVIGGRYGIYARGAHLLRGSQPAPVVSAVTLREQTDAAVLYDGRGPLTLAGANIEGAGIIIDAPAHSPFNGPLNLVDSVVRITGDRPAIATTHSVVLHDVHFSGAQVLVSADGEPRLNTGPATWTHVAAWADEKQAAVLVDGASARVAQLTHDHGTPSPDILARHARPRPLPDWTAATNVRAAPYSAAGDGKTDDTDALQRAIDEHDNVFLPRGEYALSRPLTLRARTRLFGVHPAFSALIAIESAPAFRDALHPVPLVETVDDPEAATELASLELRLPVCLAGAYALRWSAGRRSIVRLVNFERTFWDPDAPGLFHPFVRIDRSGGGAWYNFQMTSWWSQGLLYRHLLIDSTTEPLRFYMLDVEHARCDPQVEVRSARNVSIFSCKAEGNYPVLGLSDCEAIRIFGYGGVGAPWPGWPLIRLSRCRDLLLAHVVPQLMPYHSGRWTALGIAVGTDGWSLIDHDGRAVPPSPHVAYYRLTP